MKRMELVNGGALEPLKPPAGEVPHAVIETNYTCNRSCVLCYNGTREGIKPLAQIASEVDQVLAKRNLETISILGGEPTLHPDLPAVVRYIKKKNVYCQLLTNGIILFSDTEDVLLDRLMDSGIDRIVLHLDSGQGLSDRGMEVMRTTLFRKFEERGVFFALSSTLYRDNCGSIPALMKSCAHFRHFDGILATLARPTEEMIRPVSPAFGRPDLREVDESVRRGLSVLPSSYLPSSLDDEEIRWLMYLYYINAATGATVPLSPAFVRLMRKFYRFFAGRNMFAATTRLSQVGMIFLATAALECLRDPSRIRACIRLVSDSRFLKEIRFHSIIVQSVPDYNKALGSVEICYQCPDATIRNGRLAPVCLADVMDPPRPEGAGTSPSPLGAAIYAHLENT